MSTITVHACEECGHQSTHLDRWLIVKKIDIRSSKSGEGMVNTDDDLDFCSPGCLLRHVSRSLEHAMNELTAEHQVRESSGFVEDAEEHRELQVA